MKNELIKSEYRDEVPARKSYKRKHTAAKILDEDVSYFKKVPRRVDCWLGGERRTMKQDNSMENQSMDYYKEDFSSIDISPTKRLNSSGIYKQVEKKVESKIGRGSRFATMKQKIHDIDKTISTIKPDTNEST